MEPPALPLIDSVFGAASGAAVALLVIVNGAFAAGVVLLKDRGFVDRWTKALIIADVALISTAVGAPVIGVAMKLGVKAFAMLGLVPATVASGVSK